MRDAEICGPAVVCVLPTAVTQLNKYSWMQNALENSPIDMIQLPVILEVSSINGKLIESVQHPFHGVV